MNPKKKRRVGPDTWRRDQAAECAWNLASVVQEAGGRLSESMLDMTLREFVCEVASQNGIRFVHRPPEGD